LVFQFSVTRGVASTVVGLTGSAFDAVLFGGSLNAGAILGGAISNAITFAEQLALLPLVIGESVTSTSLVAAHSTVNVLSTMFPGSDDASFSLASFVTLVRREWTEPILKQHIPEKKYGAGEIAAALVAWSALQSVTASWKEKAWFNHLREIDVYDQTAPETQSREKKDSQIRVNSDVILPHNRGQVLTADIGDVHLSPQVAGTRSRRWVLAEHAATPEPLSNTELKTTLRRLSKLVLAGYGGASLIFFGISPVPRWAGASGPGMKEEEEANLAEAIDASEREAVADPTAPDVAPNEPKYSWWDVLMGRHDNEIFRDYATAHSDHDADKTKAQLKAKAKAASVVAGNYHLMPRFWVLTDHERGQVVLVMRGVFLLFAANKRNS
jgi:sn1-specific diacylglycerol lipase